MSRTNSVGADDSVRPLGKYEFAADFRVSDVQFAGRTEASAPTSGFKQS